MGLFLLLDVLLFGFALWSGGQSGQYETGLAECLGIIQLIRERGSGRTREVSGRGTQRGAVGEPWSNTNARHSWILLLKMWEIAM